MRSVRFHSLPVYSHALPAPDRAPAPAVRVHAIGLPETTELDQIFTPAPCAVGKSESESDTQSAGGARNCVRFLFVPSDRDEASGDSKSGSDSDGESAARDASPLAVAGAAAGSHLLSDENAVFSLSLRSRALAALITGEGESEREHKGEGKRQSDGPRASGASGEAKKKKKRRNKQKPSPRQQEMPQQTPAHVSAPVSVPVHVVVVEPLAPAQPPQPSDKPQKQQKQNQNERPPALVV